MIKTFKLFDPELRGHPMRAMAFMSGSGTNVRKILKYQNNRIQENGASPFQVVGIYSDRSGGKCMGEGLASEFGIPYFSYDIRRFHKLRKARRTIKTDQGLKLRYEYDELARALLHVLDIDVVILGGYMSYTTIKRAVNVHPADLTILDSEGKRKYVGDNAVYDAILDGCTEVRSSTIWIDEGVDTGPILMVSNPVTLEFPPGTTLENLKQRNSLERLRDIALKNQERLKEEGDWNIFPLTLRLMAEGRFSMDQHGKVYFDNTFYPKGLRLDEVEL